jgi:hypothetical protein
MKCVSTKGASRIKGLNRGPFACEQDAPDRIALQVVPAAGLEGSGVHIGPHGLVT